MVQAEILMIIQQGLQLVLLPDLCNLSEADTRAVTNRVRPVLASRPPTGSRAFSATVQPLFKLPEGESPTCDIATGIPRGSPISPILYMFYNADIANICRSKGHFTSTFIDDVSIL